VPRRHGQLHHGAGAVDRLAPLGHNSSAGFAVVISSRWSSGARPDGGIRRAPGCGTKTLGFASHDKTWSSVF
jgi:hypothetical protein